VNYLVHVAAVQGEPGAGFRPVRNLGDCVAQALRQADNLAQAGHPARTILIPVLGAGTGGGHTESSVHALLTAAVDYLVDTPRTALHAVYFLAYTDGERAAFATALAGSRAVTPVRRTEDRGT